MFGKADSLPMDRERSAVSGQKQEQKEASSVWIKKLRDRRSAQARQMVHGCWTEAEQKRICTAWDSK